VALSQHWRSNKTGNSRHEDHEDLHAILPTSPTTASRGKPLQAVTRRQFTTFFKQTVVGNHYSCLQNVVRQQFLGQRSGQRRRGKNRYRGGEHRRYRPGGRGGRKFTSRSTGTRRGFRGGAAKPTAIGRGLGRTAGRRRGQGTTRRGTGCSNGEKCNMTPRLQFWYGNSKDRTSIEWWCDAVDRIKDQKGGTMTRGKSQQRR
jgi:hypothetical protein